jgi:hypothetical protein
MHLTLTSDRVRHLLDRVVQETQECLTAVELDEQTAGRLDEVARSAGLVREQLNALQDDLIGHAAI